MIVANGMGKAFGETIGSNRCWLVYHSNTFLCLRRVFIKTQWWLKNNYNIFKLASAMQNKYKQRQQQQQMAGKRDGLMEKRHAQGQEE